MSNNFHSADCMVRHGTNNCTCGYVKPPTKLEKKNAKLVTAWEVIDGYVQYHESDIDEIPEQKAGIKWIREYEMDGKKCVH